MTKYIFLTGGVLSSVGKGVTAAALGRLLKEHGFSVSVQKLDPYINVDPGTMNPFQHGEVFVTDDGAEADPDVDPGALMQSSATAMSEVTSVEFELERTGAPVFIDQFQEIALDELRGQFCTGSFFAAGMSSGGASTNRPKKPSPCL